ncbi:hypothetical protein GGTG_13428 [Gaeumannomyces tritici R3-111a-1]|uniref:Uncharacterized protein n=1 Tax=Gaeumannomyces tritici (strain R3-111a-1) TaxID=644352 RepID=J3PIU8_GAET3|nr:hypothetical protein GGTG_13428 [Gaeumannomyces tritici R3-111a-1]EJT69031.1 hypothetical protein GGTG_13428 [Gaeumannomyces tritici R3-111a-1]
MEWSGQSSKMETVVNNIVNGSQGDKSGEIPCRDAGRLNHQVFRFMRFHPEMGSSIKQGRGDGEREVSLTTGRSNGKQISTTI